VTVRAGFTARSLWWLTVAGLSVISLLACIMTVLLLVDDPVAGLTPAGGITFAVVGGLLVARQPDNAVGRLLVAMGLVWAVGEAAFTYLEVSPVHPDLVIDFVTWLNVWAFWPMFALATFVVALFPSGRVASSWMRWPLRLGFLVGISGVVARMILPVETDQQTFGEEFADNPWAVDSLTWLSPLAEVLDYLVLGFLALAVVDLVLRWRRSRGVERLQMRWLALGFVMFIVLLTTAIVVEAAGITGLANELAWTAAWLVGLGAIPVAVGVAVARYRLYEIDRLVSRTVSYAVVLSVLAGVYAAVVFLLQNLLPLEGDVAVAGSTLAVAALFNPLRVGVQMWVDRRFNRSRYDAQQVADVFTGRLQDEMDSDRVVDGWVGVISETMQPSNVGVWLKGRS